MNMYSLLTGLRPFYDSQSTEEVQERIMHGDTPAIDSRYRKRSFVEGKLVEIIERCWAYEPDDRPTIFEIVEFLRDAVVEFESDYNE